MAVLVVDGERLIDIHDFIRGAGAHITVRWHAAAGAAAAARFLGTDAQRGGNHHRWAKTADNRRGACAGWVSWVAEQGEAGQRRDGLLPRRLRGGRAANAMEQRWQMGNVGRGRQMPQVNHAEGSRWASNGL